ncbi:MAG: restriction endonuclease subunit S [Euryarchaeota archaeon]|nr:restriction endonuclease subunit S [Euryarchaeota archaeon]MCG2738551.1 restriction endonuclease subunit S [Candidatus Methanoperedenaceae archaeon]
MSEWKEYRLGEVSTVQTGPFGSQLHQSDYKLIGTPIITVEHLGENKILHQDIPLVSNEDKERLNKYVLAEGDIVFSRVGSVDRRAYVSKNEDGWMFSGRCLRVRVNKEIVDPKYLSYYFGQESFKEHIRMIAVGATMPSINTEILSGVVLNLPDLPEQQSIASILSSLDDKIDLLHRQNKTLEALAETLFRQWFVEEADEGWEAGSIEDEFDFTMGQSPPGSSYNEDGTGHVFFQGRTDFGFRFPEPRVYTTEPKRLAKRLDTLVSVRAPVGDMNMALQDCCLGRGVAAFRYKYNPSFTTYTYYKLRSLMAQIKQFEDNGTVFGSIGKDDFKKLENIIPPKELIQTFQSEAAPLDEKILKNTIQIRTITRLRDTLLPKLMSGEVSVV